MKIRAIIIIDAHGDYIVHGTSEQTPAEMFKAIQPLWGFDPSTEDVHFIEVEVPIPGREQDQNAPATDAQ